MFLIEAINKRNCEFPLDGKLDDLQCMNYSDKCRTSKSNAHGCQATHILPLAFREKLWTEFQPWKIDAATFFTFFTFTFVSNRPMRPTLLLCKKSLTSAFLISQFRPQTFQLVRLSMRVRGWSGDSVGACCMYSLVSSSKTWNKLVYWGEIGFIAGGCYLAEPFLRTGTTPSALVADCLCSWGAGLSGTFLHPISLRPSHYGLVLHGRTYHRVSTL